MRKHLIVIGLFLASVAAFVAVPCRAQSQPATAPSGASNQQQIDDTLADIQKLSAQPTTGMAPAVAQRFRHDANASLEALDQIRAMVNDGRLNQAGSVVANTLNNMNGAAFRPDWETLRGLLAQQEELSRQTAAVRLQAFLDDLPTRLMACKTGDDVKKIQTEAQKMRVMIETSGLASEHGLDMNRINTSLQDEAFDLFRDFLDAGVGGNIPKALGSGQSLLNRDFPARKLVEQKMTELRAQLKMEIDRRLAEMKQTFSDGSDIAKASKAEEMMQNLRQDYSTATGGTIDAGSETTLINRESQVLEQWLAILNDEGHGLYHRALSELNSSAAADTRSDPQFAPSIFVTADILDNKKVELAHLIAGEADNIREPVLQNAAKLLDQAKTLDDLVAAANECETMISGAEGEVDNRTVLNEVKITCAKVRGLVTMRDAIALHKWGDFWAASESLESPAFLDAAHQPDRQGTFADRRRGPAQYQDAAIEGEPHIGNRWDKTIDTVYLSLCREALLSSMELPGIKPASDDEPIDKMLLRLTDEAIGQKRYRDAAIILRAYEQYVYGYDAAAQASSPDPQAPAWLIADANGLEMFAEATSFDAAKDYAEAVALYRQVILSTGPRVPVEAATERLKAIIETTGQFPLPSTRPAMDSRGS